MSCSGCARRRAKLKAMLDRKKRAGMRSTFNVGSDPDLQKGKATKAK